MSSRKRAHREVVEAPESPSRARAAAEDEPSVPAAKQAAAAGPATMAAKPAPGVYMPPFKLAQLMAAEAAQDKTGPQYQRLTWDALRKSINALVNKVTAQNLKLILHELFHENLERGKGLLCRSLMRSQLASPTYTAVFASLVAVINSKFPDIGLLLASRVVLQFKRAYRRSDRPVAIAAIKFIAHLVNQQVLPEVVACEIGVLLLTVPTEDSVEMAVNFLKETGALLSDTNRLMVQEMMDVLRTIASEGKVEQRTVFMIEELFRVRRVGFAESGFPAMPDELDLVEDVDRLSHKLELDDPLDAQLTLDIFKPDPDFEEHEAQWETIRASVLGQNEESEEEGGEDEEGDEADGSDSEASDQDAAPMEIRDATETNIINLRRTIYLTIMSAMDFEEAGHKLLKIELGDGQEAEVVLMVIECCSQEKTYLNYYGLLAQRFCMLHQKWQALFEDCFSKQYGLIHRLETNKLRNVAKFFAHLLYNDAISWAVLTAIRLTEDETTSSSRIFVKILFQEMAENMGMLKLNERLQDPMAAGWVHGIFPRDTPRNMRFAINFFTQIQLGPITDGLRAHLKELPKLIAAQQAMQAAAASSSSSSDSDSSSDSGSDSDSSSSSSSDDSDSGTSSASPEPAPPPRRASQSKPEAARSQPAANGRSELIGHPEPEYQPPRVASKVVMPSKRSRAEPDERDDRAADAAPASSRRDRDAGANGHAEERRDRDRDRDRPHREEHRRDDRQEDRHREGDRERRDKQDRSDRHSRGDREERHGREDRHRASRRSASPSRRSRR